MHRPSGWPTVIPRVFTSQVEAVCLFLKNVFGASGEVRAGAPSEIWIGDSPIMISDGGGVREARPVFLYVYVQDADETYRRALKAGARSVEGPADMPYGDRRATVEDAWGNVWQIATYRGGRND